MSKFTIGIDVGGTNVKLGLINNQGKIVERSRLDTKAYLHNKAKFIKALVEAVKDLMSFQNVKKAQLIGVGLGLPGLIDSQTGVVEVLPNIPGWKKVPLKKIIQQKLGVPVFIDNDVNVITLGEWRYGAGKGVKNLICMTLGTGVGAGLILNDALYRGEGFVAGELGHIPLNEHGPDCGCGGFGCFETYVGNGYIMKKAAKIFKKKDIIPPDVFKLAEAGNVRAKQFWQEVGNHIGNGLIGPINLLNPKLIIIGGGVSNNLKYMNPTIKEVIQRRAMKVQKRMVKIVRSKLKDDAGLIGAHVLVKESLLEKSK